MAVRQGCWRAARLNSPIVGDPEGIQKGDTERPGSRLLDTDFRIGEHSNNLHLKNPFSVLSSESAHPDEMAGAVLCE